MDEQEVAIELRKAGYRVHKNDGVWWQQVVPFFCKPVDPLRVLQPFRAAPSFAHSLLGYSHIVSYKNPMNRTWSVMLLSRELLENFEIGKLKPKRRSSVRKALRELEIRPITNILPVLHFMNEICISTAKRTQHGKPVKYYIKERKKWESMMLREFSIPKREWWGAYSGERLVAYYYSYLIGSTMFISAAKSHTDFLNLCPNDGLSFSLLEYFRNIPGCFQVIYGDWSPDVPSLNRFKEYFGFERNDLPVYRHERIAFRILKRAVQTIRKKSSIWQ